MKDRISQLEASIREHWMAMEDEPMEADYKLWGLIISRREFLEYNPHLIENLIDDRPRVRSDAEWILKYFK